MSTENQQNTANMLGFGRSEKIRFLGLERKIHHLEKRNRQTIIESKKMHQKQ